MGQAELSRVHGNVFKALSACDCISMEPTREERYRKEDVRKMRLVMESICGSKTSLIHVLKLVMCEDVHISCPYLKVADSTLLLVNVSS